MAGPTPEMPSGGITPLPPPRQTEKIELLQAALGAAVPLAYGRHVVGGNVIFEQENADETVTLLIALGEGEWDALETLFINGVSQTLPDTARIHFHPGIDGELGVESDPAIRNAKICSFYPATFSPQLTFSGFAYLALKLTRDPRAPGPEFDIRGVYKTMRVRQFDASGNQTAYSYSTNPAWCLLDLLIRRVIKPHGKVNEALIAAEKDRIDFQSFLDAATACDFDVGGGQKRFEANVAFIEQTDLLRALEQLLLLCRGYLLERAGKFALFIDQARASQLTADRDFDVAGSLAFPRKDLRSLANKITLRFRDLGSGAGDPAKDFQTVTREFSDEDHQDQVGRIIPVEIDLGNQIPGRAFRLGSYFRDRTLKLRRQARFTLLPGKAQAAQNPLDLLPGDVITGPDDVDGFTTRLWEILEITDEPDGSRSLGCQEYDASIFSDARDTQTVLHAPTVLALPLFVGTARAYHRSAVRAPTTTNRLGQTSATIFTTVASFAITLPPGVTEYKGAFTTTVITAPPTSFGPATSTTEVNDATVGTVDWASLANIRASDNARAGAALLAGEISKYLKATGYAFSIPSDHAILGIEVRIERSKVFGTGAIEDNSIKLVKGGVIGGAEKASPTEWPTTDAVQLYGSTTDLWGLAWTPADINAANFGVAISAKELSGLNSATAGIDHVTITVYTDGGTYVMEGRLKIGSLLSNVISVTEPATVASGTATVVSPGSGALTVEVQARIAAGGAGTVEAKFEQVQYTDQDEAHFSQ